MSTGAAGGRLSPSSDRTPSDSPDLARCLAADLSPETTESSSERETDLEERSFSQSRRHVEAASESA